MNSRNVTLSLLFILLLMVVFLCRRALEPKRKEALNRFPQQIIYSKLALCNMNCIAVQKKEVQEIIESGIILFHRSQRNKRPCPIYTLQGTREKGGSLQLIIEQCQDQTKVLDCFLPAKNIKCNCAEE